jgi:iron complex transport system substrate-binding protein
MLALPFAHTEIVFDKYASKGYILPMWFILILILVPLSAHSYDRIISLSPQITESIYLVDAEERLVGITDFCKRPPETKVKEKIGTPLRPDVEKIVSMDPDMVLGSREGNSPFAMVRLERLGIRTHYFDRPRTINDVLDNFLTLSRIVGAEEKGKRIAEVTRRSLRRAETNRATRVLWQVGAEPLIVASQKSFANDIIRLAGGYNIIESELPYPRINIEEVILKSPHVIVLMDMGYNIQTETERWKRYFKSAQFVTMDAYSVGSPTPVSVVDAVNRLAEALKAGETEPLQ